MTLRLNLELTADASGLRGEIKLSEQDLAQLKTTAEQAGAGVQASVGRMSAGVEQAAQQFKQVRASLDPAAAALERYEAQQQAVKTALLANVATQDEANRVLALAKSQYDSVVAAASGYQEALRGFQQVRASLDPAVAALERYEAQQQAVQRAVAAGAASQEEASRVLALAAGQYESTTRALAGLDQAAREFDQIRASVDPAAAALARYEAQQEAVQRAVAAGVATEQEASRVLALAAGQYESTTRALSGVDQVAREFQQVRASIDPTTAALERYEAQQEAVQRAVAAGVVTQDEANRVLGLAKGQYDTYVATAAKAAAGTKNFGFGAQNAAFQLQDLVVQLQAGVPAARTPPVRAALRDSGIVGRS
ncbi:hypothetical protein SAMN06265365_14848 [Tistlia consotensis]|uniref:Uncharacterized protein n=1 Tax=Tistlia consotensis USBA 355 TaxID=560819 RepID=A0A1Y6CRM1_9PROT|nr:hypothetical protein [Tistlia consotensis]SMF83099.1 hypothetical protein SAMN05428998_14849 [Tistlia consotensis USBA 355]SNS32046.1 hypothetical protein SAMN06265365_14848 [Tistlia consotensis]